MADSSEKKIEPFNRKLFGSPSGSNSGLGEGFDVFSSPFSLGPALSTSKEASSSPSKLSVSSHQGSPGPGSTHTSRNGSPLPVRANMSSSSVGPGGSNQAQDSATLSNLDTIPLDSPDQSDSATFSVSQSTTIEALSSTTAGDSSHKLLVSAVRKEQLGWNDPPSDNSSTPSRTTPGTKAAEEFQIQPLAPKQLETTLASGVQGKAMPPPAADPLVSNPYRIGSGLAIRKPAYGSSGIASFGSSQPPVSSHGSVSNPNIMVPPQPVPSSGRNPEPPLFSGQDQFQMSVPVSAYSSVSMPSVSTMSTTSTGAPPLMGGAAAAAGEGGGIIYMPVRQHWFYLRPDETYWIPFSLVDSRALETASQQMQDPSQQVLVPTDGGRYDVDLHARKRMPVYWAEPESLVRRCSWFFKGQEDRWYLPYDENAAGQLEGHYKTCCEQAMWNRHVPLSNGESVAFHSQGSIVHHPAPPPSHMTLDIEAYHAHPKAVMRGFSDLDKVESGEELKVEHLVFVVHGIGAHCDLSFRSLVDCVDDFREVSQLMFRTHKFQGKGGMAGSEFGESSQGHGGDWRGRIEYLPVHWHSTLHTSDVDEHLKSLTLPSISRLREFTNTTLLDILYFTSPLFCQTIMSAVASEMNRMFEVFKTRNPSFDGGVSLVGHSLGSVILFDLLCHQDTTFPPAAAGSFQDDEEVATSDGSSVPAPSVSADNSQVGLGEVGGEDNEVDGGVAIKTVLAQLGLESLTENFQKEQIDLESLLLCSNEDLCELGLGFGPRKKLSTFIKQHKENRELQRQKKVEARERAQREEEERKKAELSDEATDGRSSSKLFGAKIVYGLAGTGQACVKYPTLLFSPQNLFALGSPIGLFLTVRGLEELGPEFLLPTGSKLFNIYHPFDPVAYRIEPLITDSAPDKGLLMPHHKGRKRFHLELYDNLGTMGASIKHHLVEGMRNMWQQLNEFARSHAYAGTEAEDSPPVPQSVETDSVVSSELGQPQEKDWLGGAINDGRRVDHVLQEKPIEKLNEYLFALSSHLCYWRSEDTALFLLKEVYNCQGAPSSP